MGALMVPWWAVVPCAILLVGWLLALAVFYVRGRRELDELQRFYERMREK